MPIQEVFNYQPITDSIASSGLASEEQLAELAAQGFDAVINLLPHDNEYAIADEQAIVEEQGLAYHSIPVDFNQPTAEDFEKFSSLLKHSDGKKILIHCAANYRVSAFYALYAFKQLGWSEQQCEDLISPIWNPQEHPPWPEFMDTIKNGEKKAVK